MNDWGKQMVKRKSMHAELSTHLKSVMNSLNPRIIKATIAHGGGKKLLPRLLAS